MKKKLITSLIIIISVTSLHLLMPETPQAPNKLPTDMIEDHQAAPRNTALPESNAQTVPTLQNLREWAQSYSGAPSSQQPHLLQQGIEIAEARMNRMNELIRNDPEQALLESLSLSEWLDLPATLRPYVEEPLSSTADLDVYISCGTSTSIDRITTLDDGRQFETYTSANRRLAKTRKKIPVQGIKLGKIGALRASIFQPLDDADLAAACTLYPVANANPMRCFSSGRTFTLPPVTALAGGRIYYFGNNDALEQLEQSLAVLDGASGPSPASALLTSALLSENPDAGFNIEQAARISAELATEWSGSVRDMLVIMVDFSDIPGQPVNPLQLEYNINAYVSQQIYDMSFQQSHINCTVLTNTYRLPEPSTFYSSNHRPIHDHAVAAVTDAGIDLSGYETICVYFPFVPALASLRGYASLGGEKLWLHNTSNLYVITHELGHNYGSYHAHSWNVTGSNPVDPAGEHEEYGDFSDIMGGGQLPDGHFHVQNKLEVGWLNENHVLSVTNSGTARIYRTDHPLTETNTLRGLKLDLGGTNAYWVGYRQLYPELETYGRGTYILWQQSNPSNYPKSHLLDMTPGSSGGKEDGGLALGTTWSDAASQLHITPVRRGGNTPNEWVDVTINFGSFSNNLPPVASLLGPTNGNTRQSLTFAVEASDPDGDDLAYSWDFGDGLVNNNGEQTSHAWMQAGTQTVRCTVSDMKGGTETVEQTITIGESLTWPHQQTITTHTLFDIATDEQKLVTVGGPDGVVATSTNGIDWTAGNVGGVYASVYLRGVIHDGTQFIAAGMDYNAGWVGTLYTSPDGINWTRRFFSNSPGLTDVTSKGIVRIAVGSAGTVLRSTDGQDWYSVNSGITGDLRSVSNNGNLFCAVGRELDGTTIAYISVDGIKWVDFSTAAGSGLVSDLENCNGQLLASGPSIGIRRSTDGGQSFTTVANETMRTPAFAYGNGIFLAAGRYDSAGLSDINLLSTDGISWNPVPTDQQADRNAAVFFDNSFITVGQNGSVWKSEPINPEENGWAVWQYLNRTAFGLNRDATDDPDGDGILNLIEYALGTDAADPSSTPTAQSGIDALGYLQMEIPRSRTAADLDYIVERNTNLLDKVSWNNIETTIVTNLPKQLIIRSTHPVSAQDQEFLRLRIRLKPLAP